MHPKVVQPVLRWSCGRNALVVARLLQKVMAAVNAALLGSDTSGRKNS